MGNMLQYGNYGILEIENRNCRASRIGNMPILHASFEVTKYWKENFPSGSEYVMITNCYGEVKICDMIAGKLDYPTFFKCLSHLPEFRVQLTSEIVTLIEEKRGNRDVNVSFELVVLCAFDKNHTFDSMGKICEQRLYLNFNIPKSKWLEEFLPRWDYFNANEVIIPLTLLNDNTSIKKHIADARRSYSFANYRETMVATYRALEALYKGLGYPRFDDMLEKFKGDGDSKRKQISSMFKQIKAFLHMARHDNTELLGGDETKEFTRDDAKLALTYAQMIIEYVLNNKQMFLL